MRSHLIALVVVLSGLLAAGCGKHYWEAPRRGIAEFQADSATCIREAES